MWEGIQQELQLNQWKALSEKDYIDLGKRLLAKKEGWFQPEAFKTLQSPTAEYIKDYKSDHPGASKEEIANSYMKVRLREMLQKEETKPKAPGTVKTIPIKPTTP